MKKLKKDVDYIIVKPSLFGIFGGKYKLIKRQVYYSNIRPSIDIDEKYYKCYRDGRIVGEIGYQWDGATGGIDTDDFMRGSLFHDIGCQAIGEDLLPQSYRKSIDKMLYSILSEDGMSGLRRTYVYHMIRLYVKIVY